MNIENKERLLIIAIIIVGICFIIGGFITAKNSLKFKDNKIETKAEIIKVSENKDSDNKTAYTIHISYNVSGKQYMGKISSSNRIMREKEITIYYDKNDPWEFSTTKTNIKGIWTIIIGIVFLVSGLKVLTNKYD